MTRERVARHLKRFRAAPPPDEDDWGAWRALITDRSGAAAEQLHVVPRNGYGTVCSSLLGLAKQEPPVWLFTASADAASFESLWIVSAAVTRQA